MRDLKARMSGVSALHMAGPSWPSGWLNMPYEHAVPFQLERRAGECMADHRTGHVFEGQRTAARHDEHSMGWVSLSSPRSAACAV